MKMRRIRVRSLLAGCISCLRCVRTSALTCRSSPLCVPPRSSRLLSVRGASLFSLLLRLLKLRISSAAQQRQRCAFQGIFSVHIGAGCWLPLPSPLLAAAFIYRCDGPSWTSGSRPAISRRVLCTRVNPHCGVAKTLPAPFKDAVDALDGK